ncbi:hypothetical protein V490_08971, partial [Pseudogymnoascus sp. VKM F-3557]
TSAAVRAIPRSRPVRAPTAARGDVKHPRPSSSYDCLAGTLRGAGRGVTCTVWGSLVVIGVATTAA